ncbi:NADP-dependent oxidoreductase [Luteimonas sp. XNQY3]|nr:NADP-dependent oxidoreductase [Luteimonas sp. XNQY3]MCD9005120.1 NADP-dependent oxidoreductase [Luteimonas sp. XNQY3]
MTFDDCTPHPASGSDDAGTTGATAHESMLALAFERFGGPEVLSLVERPIPLPGPGQALVRVLSAGFGPWDVLEREGALAPFASGAPVFPYVPGAEGAGTVVEVGAGVQRLREGDRVCGLLPLRSPKHGFHAQFVVVDVDHLWPVPPRLTLPQAAALPVDGGLAMHAVAVALALGPGDTALVFGASGGIGHMALQFARQRGARVLAVASGADGVALAERLGADMAIDGRRHALAPALRIFAPDGLDAALLTAQTPDAGVIVDALRPGGRIAWPRGVNAPPARDDIAASAFGAGAGARQVHAACRAAARGPFHLHIDTRFPLADAAAAARAIERHHLGRIVLDVP